MAWQLLPLLLPHFFYPPARRSPSPPDLLLGPRLMMVSRPLQSRANSRAAGWIQCAPPWVSRSDRPGALRPQGRQGGRTRRSRGASARAAASTDIPVQQQIHNHVVSLIRWAPHWPRQQAAAVAASRGSGSIEGPGPAGRPASSDRGSRTFYSAVAYSHAISSSSSSIRWNASDRQRAALAAEE